MPPQVPALNPALAQLGQRLIRMEAKIAQLERNQRASQMGNTSIDAGALIINDASGNQALTIGRQPDGTYTTSSVTSQAPPVAPDEPLCGPGVLGIWVYWDGAFADGSAPLADFAGIQVHCSAIPGFTPDATTLQGIMPGMGLFGVGNLTGGTTYYVVLVAFNEAGNTSPPSAQAQCQAGSVPANIPPGSISGLQIQTGTLTAAQLAGEAGILGTQIAANTITDANIQAGTITAESIASNVITAAQIIAGIVIAGIVDGTTITGAQFVAYGTTGEVLVYSGTPAPGNLVASVSGAAGNDLNGNPYAQGIEIQQGGLILASQASPPAPVSGASELYTSSAGRLRYLSSSGADVVLDRSALDLTNVSMGTSTTPVIMSRPLSYLAGEAVAGSEYEIEIDGTFTSGANSGIAFGFDLFVDGASLGIGANEAVGSVIVQTNRTYSYTVRYRLTVESAGSGGNCTVAMDGSVTIRGANAGNAQAFTCLNNIAVSGAFDTTSNHTLAIYCNWSGTTGTGASAITYRTKITRRN